ncbi:MULTISPECIES: PadR family transcriptional regulator [Microbacterium]|uniref:PadR family transcriptional regulator n=1 Tax=Microbacterium TaxID=33882 RepID=UPI00277E16E7|nr:MULTISPECIES: helix-turn-helix transcriptional regulator [Microbacterium]MDQ1084892.1 DNA-binding PadR family transcriptional regulator [Microbacterium sp. SORGH_AS_0344]MDQ1169830.1 DNA-binding PadR family transcriptional regulator [Microbacterium proteolyticum]
MSVRQSLLAILDRGACYGSQLRAEYERRTGARVNVGQVYTTLERLERDGMVVGAGVDEEARVLWEPTPAGRAEAHAWLSTASLAEGRDEVALKVALAVTLPGADVGGILSVQRAAVRAALAEAEDGEADAVPAAIVRAARRARLEADLRWLDEVEALTAEATPFGLSEERPRRGRPARSAV